MKKFKLKLSVYIFIELFAVGVCADDSVFQQDSLCYDFEEIYMSCRIENKIVSICASGNDMPSNGYVSYRYGLPNAIEIEYPKDHIAPNKLFTLMSSDAANDQEISITFKNGIYLYKIAQNPFLRLSVTKNSKVLFNKTCDSDGLQRFSPKIYRGIHRK